MKTKIIFSLFIYITACQNKNSIQPITINSPEIKSFIQEFAAVRQTNLVLMNITNQSDSIDIELEEFYSTCQLDLNDEYGYLVSEEWDNITAPMFVSTIGEIEVYIQSGIEGIVKSRKRYEQLRMQLADKIDFCLESYNKEEDSFTMNAPKTSTLMPWKLTIYKIDFGAGNGTRMVTYRSKREGYNDFYYEKDTVKIDSNYMERYY